MKIDVLWDAKEAGHIAPLVRTADALRRLGYDLTFAECQSFARPIQCIRSDSEAILIHQTLVSDELLGRGLPVIILERIDGAQLGQSRQWMEREEVLAVIKGYTFRDPQLNNTVRGRYQAKLLADAGVVPTGPSIAIAGMPKPQLSDDALRKIFVGYGFAAYDFMQAFHVDVDWESPRPCPVMFAGWLEYSGSEIETHRRECIRIIAELGGLALSGRTLNVEQYRTKLDRSKTVASPWGWGEPCYRDCEAILRGCVLLKPDSSHVKGWPDVFGRDFPGYSCKPDWIDLPEAVELAGKARDYAMVREQLQDARHRIIKSWQPDAIAIRFAGIFDQVL